MELFIETLTGTAFELRVSPFETIMSVKAKIQRLEGIPIAQQHLIWQSMELEDDYCLHDYSIHDGATLKLVLAMRGGPINTRRIPMEDPALREMAEYVEANRDEIWEKLPGNRQVTLLVFREGDQLNFFRVVDRGDGTLTPLSESLSAASMYNFNDDDDDDDSPGAEKSEENEKLKDRMTQLRTKMEKLTLNKKQHRRKPKPPTSGRASSRLRLRHISSSAKSSAKELNKMPCLPPVGYNFDTQLSCPDPVTGERSPPVSKPCDVKEITGASSGEIKESGSSSSNAENCDISSSRQKSEQLLKELYKDPLPPDKDKTSLATGACSVPSSSVVQTSKMFEDSDILKPLSTTLSSIIEKNTAEKSSNIKFNIPTMTGLSLPKHMDGKSVKRESGKDPLVPRTRSKKKGELTFEELKEVLGKPPTSTKKKDFSLDSFKEFVRSPSSTSKYSGLDRMKEFTLESLSTSEAQAMSGLLKQASIEKLGTSRIGSFVTSASKSRLGTLNDGRMKTPDGRLLSSRLQRVSNSRDGRIMSPSHRLPPMKSKKKSGKRCFLCEKKTGLATSYQCRCGNNFCATHRYAESHDCTFDYKSEGRKLLEQSNPVISAPKLPKI